jgi:predicted GNAT family acetyltransferase
MSETDVVVRDNPEARQFEATVEGHLAYAEYRLIDHGVMFTHTEVPAALEGRGVGSALVRAGLNAARERGLKVLPVCTFFAGYIKRHPEEQDLLHPDYFAVLGLEPPTVV